MRLFWFVFITGGIFFYFIDQAVDVDSFSKELMVNNLYHFLVGFLFIIGMQHFKYKFKFKILLPLIFTVLVLGEIYDFFIEITNFSILSLLYNIYVLFWGVVSGFAYSKSLKSSEKTHPL
jgi:hypothetical protein